MTTKCFSLFCFLTICTLCFAKKQSPYTFYKTDSKEIYGICLTQNRSMLAVADNRDVKVFSTESADLLQVFSPGHHDRILSVDISKDGTLLASAGKDSTIVLWDFLHSGIIQTLRIHQGIVTSVKFSPDGQYLLSGGSDHHVILYDLKQKRIIREFEDHHNDITSVSFSLDGSRFASTGGDGLICVYDLPGKTLITSFAGSKNWIRDICFSSDGNHLLTCGDDAKINDWDITNPENVALNQKKIHLKDWLISVDVSESDSLQVVGAVNGGIEIQAAQYKYIGKIGTPVNKVLLLPCKEEHIRFVVSTIGKGVFKMDASSMNLIMPKNMEL